MIQYRKLYSAANMIEGSLIKGILEEHSIETNLRGGNLSVGIGELPVDVISVDLLVNVDKFEEAMDIVREYEKKLREPSQDNKTWECEKCDNMNPENFTLCWNCQSIRLVQS